jgi:hypothetical protein
MVAAALAVAIALPSSDIRSAARSFVPKGSTVTLAVEHDADFGVVAWKLRGRPGAVALVWRHGGWHRASPGGLSISPAPRDGARIRQPALVHLTARGLAGVWVDGSLVQTVGGSYVLLTGIRPGVHVFTALAIVDGHAVARGWSYRLL